MTASTGEVVTVAGRGRRRGWPRASGRDRGFSTLETVITFPVVLLLLSLVVQVALVWHARNVAEAAAQDGMRMGTAYASDPSLAEASTREYLAQVAPRLLLSPEVVVERGPDSLSVRVRAQVLSIVPRGLGVDEVATGPVERFVNPAAP